MERLYTIILLLTCTFLNAQIINIPDTNFKNALIDAGVDTNNDGEIQASEAEAVLSLNVGFKGISSLEGIQSFINLEVLQCHKNQLSTLDMSQNVNLYLLACWENQISDLDVTQNLNLRFLYCDENLLSVLDLSENVNLESLVCSNNLLSSLDLSQNINLESLQCIDNQLTSLYIDNGNNNNMSVMFSTGNINLTCIQIDDENATHPECQEFPSDGWCKDAWSSYSEDCSLSLTNIKSANFSLFPNPAKNELFLNSKSTRGNLKVKIFNIEGKLLSTQKVAHQDQTSIDVSQLVSGLYFLNIEDESGNTIIKKFVKE